MTSVRKLAEKLDPQATEALQAIALVDVLGVVRNEIAHDDTIAHSGNSIVDVAFSPYASLSDLLLLLLLMLRLYLLLLLMLLFCCCCCCC
jgi:hypothetical protein